MNRKWTAVQHFVRCSSVKRDALTPHLLWGHGVVCCEEEEDEMALATARAREGPAIRDSGDKRLESFQRAATAAAALGHRPDATAGKGWRGWGATVRGLLGKPRQRQQQAALAASSHRGLRTRVNRKFREGHDVPVSQRRHD